MSLEHHRGFYPSLEQTIAQQYQREIVGVFGWPEEDTPQHDAWSDAVDRYLSCVPEIDGLVRKEFGPKPMIDGLEIGVSWWRDSRADVDWRELLVRSSIQEEPGIEQTDQYQWCDHGGVVISTKSPLRRRGSNFPEDIINQKKRKITPEDSQSIEKGLLKLQSWRSQASE